jgi:hypothetical protein
VERGKKREQTEQRRQQSRHAAGSKADEADQDGLQAERQARLSHPIPQGGETERHVTRPPAPSTLLAGRDHPGLGWRYLSNSGDGGVASNSHQEFSILGF